MTPGGWAEISPCGIWRWALGRRWADGPVLGWIMLNPSTADASTDDQTIRQCMAIARRGGCGAIWVANLFAYRSPSPEVLRGVAAADRERATGPENDCWLSRMLASVPWVAVAWGAHGGESWAVPRRDAVLGMLGGRELLCLGLTANGSPRHPCRLAASVPLVPYTREGGAL